MRIRVKACGLTQQDFEVITDVGTCCYLINFRRWRGGGGHCHCSSWHSCGLRKCELCGSPCPVKFPVIQFCVCLCVHACVRVCACGMSFMHRL